MRQLRPGDVVVVWKLDRLSRSLKDLLHLMERIEAAGADFRSLTEAIDTTTPAGRMMMQMVGAFAEFERAMIRERTQPVWRRLGRRAALAAGVGSSETSSARKSQRACFRDGRRQSRWRGFIMSASRRSPASSASGAQSRPWPARDVWPRSPRYATVNCAPIMYWGHGVQSFRL